MGSFGERLRREREMRGISLEEIADATKIGIRSLRLLEADDFKQLPGGIFNKGFVRAYAKYLGIDEEQAVTDYLSAYSQTEEAARLEELQPDEPRIGVPSDRTPFGAIVLAILLLVGAYFGWRWWTARQASAGAPPAQTQITKPAPTPAPVTPAAANPNQSGGTTAQPTSGPPTPGTQTPSQTAPSTAPQTSPSTTPQTSHSTPPQSSSIAPTAPAAPAEGFDLVIRAKGPSWVNIRVDGRPFANKTLDSGELSVHASKEVVLWTGNAGAIEVSHNGRPLPPLGKDKEVKTITFGIDGIVR